MTVKPFGRAHSGDLFMRPNLIESEERLVDIWPYSAICRWKVESFPEGLYLSGWVLWCLKFALSSPGCLSRSHPT